VPIATYLGWNTRTPEFGGDDLCDLLGAMIPLPRSVAEATELNDPRQSLKSLYGDHAGYVRRLTASVRRLESERLLLPDDAEALIREAQESNVLR
jgi:hypothetical protein